MFYGSLFNFRHIRTTKAHIATKLLIPWVTVHSIIQKFIQGGYTMEVFNKPSRRFEIIP